MKPVCVICLGSIEEDDETRVNARGGVMHADCDPEAIRCPHCEGVLEEVTR